MGVTAAGAIGLGVLAILLLLLPIGLHVELAGARRCAILRWAFGLVRVDLLAARAPRRRAASRTRSSGLGAGRALARVRAVVSTRGLASAVAALLRRLLRATHPRELRIAAVIGLADPAETGLLLATIAAIVPLLGDARPGSVTVEPDFESEALHLDGHARFTVIPAEVVLVLLGFLVSRPVLRAGWAAARA
jgi:hypothetical protein